LLHLREVAQLTPIMVVSGNDDPATMRDVVMAGATGYVPKSAPRRVLIDAIRVIMGGGQMKSSQPRAREAVSANSRARRRRYDSRPSPCIQSLT
jgi:DNA-binding NarL/FixJ family response regulator